MPFKVDKFRTDSSDGRNFILVDEVTYYTQARGHFEKVILPTGSTSDGGSIPEAFWSIPSFTPFGPIWKGYWMHDGLYRNTAITEGEPWTQLDADRLLLEYMQNVAMPLEVQEAIYLSVRKCGEAAWLKGHP